LKSLLPGTATLLPLLILSSDAAGAAVPTAIKAAAQIAFNDIRLPLFDRTGSARPSQSHPVASMIPLHCNRVNGS
jgi:hypothetical protein